MSPRTMLEDLRAAPSPLKISSTSLVLANLVPLAGALFLGLGVLTLMALFWAENVVLGLCTALRMLVARPADPKALSEKLFLVPFFAVHYGLFTLVHGLFIFALDLAAHLREHKARRKAGAPGRPVNGDTA